MKSLNRNPERKPSRGRVFKLFIYILPVVLFFSYHPVISLGSDETMNFELSLPLIWLVLFDVLGVVLMVQRKVLFRGFGRKWLWLLFPVWVTLSVIWSLNVTRGVLTVGILWLIYIAGYVMWGLRELFDVELKQKFWKWFFGSALVACAWCVVQCVLDVAGVGREYTLMCAGCTYRMFGFPHPNGFAIEPQFMGNLLLAPAIVAVWFYLEKQNSRKLGLGPSRGRVFYNRSVGPAPKLQFRTQSVTVVKNTSGSGLLCPNFLLFCFFVITTTLFLTFSRGAIYAFVVGLIVMTVLYCSKCLTRDRKLGRAPLSVSRGESFRAIGVAWAVTIVAFLVALGAQGLMAEVSPTDDTFGTGVAKVLNHLSLGVIDVRGGAIQGNGDSPLEKPSVEKPVENFEKTEVVFAGEGVEFGTEGEAEIGKEEAVFDGYVAESTDTRLRLTGAAVMVWRQDLKTALIGVGIGGAGQALYNNGLSPAPKEIVQNEYASLLLETGVIGISLLVLTAILIIKTIIRQESAVLLLTLLVAYGTTLLFFSGLTNALQIYLLPAAIYMICLRKKLVS